MSIDRLIIEFDKALRTVALPASTVRAMPGLELDEAVLDEAARRQAAALMRVNHVGEVCAQALYQGQAISSTTPEIRESLMLAAREETEHLAWTERRIEALGGRKSLLNPFWYAGALAMGLVAGRLGDKWNLGFLAETERQVEEHLDGHLQRFPDNDRKSRRVLEQMREDEVRHAETATHLGAADLPAPVRLAMRAAARVMTQTAYYV